METVATPAARPRTVDFLIEDDRTGNNQEVLQRAFADNLFYLLGKFPEIATRNDYYQALAYTVRDRLLRHWLETRLAYRRSGAAKIVCYLSAEFLIGPQLGNLINSLGITEPLREAVKGLGQQLEDLLDEEPEPGLGNGGLGRLAACYLESLSTLEVPAIGYGIRYEFGIFDQEIHDGWQVEVSDKWLRFGNPWELFRPEATVQVKLGGHTQPYKDEHGHYRVKWIPQRIVDAIPYDMPMQGYRVGTANVLRLWAAEAPESFNFQAFNVGDYYGAVNDKVFTENITKVLYPNDETIAGKQLRLEQQYFFVSASLQDMIRILGLAGRPLTEFDQVYAAQLNDTHPSIGIAELMRLLVDENEMDWDTAWGITQRTFGYTNHTLLPEALEKWPVQLFSSLLPRHLEIIYEINRRFLELVATQFPGDNARLARMSLIDESGERYVRMAHLATVGSHAVNGVAELHSKLLRETTLRDFAELWPSKFLNVTNGVTPRRFLVLSNPRLAALINRKLGDHWIKHLTRLKQLEPLVDDGEFRAEFRQVKQANKTDFAAYLREHTGVTVDPAALFDMQVKRFHEYKRQHLNVLHVISLYQRIKENPDREFTPRLFLFGGKAAPGYYMAKLIIKLINSIAEVVNQDPQARDRMKVVFLPDYNVKQAQHIYPAADLSEQISTAGYEASGTSNMKFALNGALTIGTLDGANIEIREEVGAENFFLFGLTVDEVKQLRTRGYHPRNEYQHNPRLKAALDAIGDGTFSKGDRDLFRPLLDSLLNHDPYLVLADYQSYVDCQDQVSLAYRDQEHWTKMSILNVAKMGKFSSDRAIREYCEKVWGTKPVTVPNANHP
jgi:glycogen phosphorylase